MEIDIIMKMLIFLIIMSGMYRLGYINGKRDKEK